MMIETDNSRFSSFNYSTRVAWLALGFKPTAADMETTLVTLQEILSHPEIQVNAQHLGESLLTRCLKGENHEINRFALDGEDDLLPVEALILKLLARGADPWAEVRGDQTRVLDRAIDSGAWATVREVLAHPHRPSWDTLLNAPWSLLDLRISQIKKQPQLAHALVRAGLDPNWIDANGYPLIFHVRDLSLARWLVDQGANLKKRGGPHQWSIMTFLEIAADLSTEDQHGWASLIGYDAIPDDHVIRVGIHGRRGRIEPLFENREDLLRWRANIPGFPRAVNLLDLAVMGVVSEHAGMLDEGAPGCEWVKDLRDDPAASWPQESVDFTCLLNTSPGNVDSKSLLQSVRDYTQLNECLWGEGMGITPGKGDLGLKHKERFAGWLSSLASANDRKVVLEHWVTWFQSHPCLWNSTGASFTEFTEKPKVFSALNDMSSPRVRVTRLGLKLLQTQAIGKGAEVLIHQFFQALTDAKAVLDDKPWQGLRVALLETRGADHIQACARAQRVELTPADTQRTRTRSRP